MTDWRDEKWCGALLAAAFFLGFAWELCWLAWSHKWASTKGRVIERRLDRSPKDPLFVDYGVTYEFEVDGYVYVSSNIRPGGIGKIDLRPILIPQALFPRAEYDKGSEVTVFYDRANPRRCAIDRSGFVFPVLGLIASGIVFAVILMSALA